MVQVQGLRVWTLRKVEGWDLMGLMRASLRVKIVQV